MEYKLAPTTSEAVCALAGQVCAGREVSIGANQQNSSVRGIYLDLEERGVKFVPHRRIYGVLTGWSVESDRDEAVVALDKGGLRRHAVTA